MAVVCVCVYKYMGEKVIAMLNALEHFDNDNCIFIFFEVDQQLYWQGVGTDYFCQPRWSSK